MSSLTTQRAETLAAARAVVDAAKAQDRELTPTEQADVEAAIAHVAAIDAKTASSSTSVR